MVFVFKYELVKGREARGGGERNLLIKNRTPIYLLAGEVFVKFLVITLKKKKNHPTKASCGEISFKPIFQSTFQAPKREKKARIF